MKQYDFFKLANLHSCDKVQINESLITHELMKAMIHDSQYGIVLIEFISSPKEMFLKCTYKKKDQEFDAEDIYLLDDRTWTSVLEHVIRAQIPEDYTFEAPLNGC